MLCEPQQSEKGEIESVVYITSIVPQMYRFHSRMWGRIKQEPRKNKMFIKTVEHFNLIMGQIFETACKANHSHTWWYNMSPLTILVSLIAAITQ